MLAKRFKNGNINLKAEKEDFDGKESLLVYAIWQLYELDCTLFGDEYCIGNFDMAVDLYSYYHDVLIRFPYSLLDDLEKGKTIKLYARKLDKYDREEYKRLEELEEI